MASIGTLQINIQASTAGLDKGIQSATSSIKGFASAVGAVAIGNLIAGQVKKVANGFIDLVKGSFESVDALSKMSEATGVSVEGLMAIRKQSKEAGVDFEQSMNAIKKFEGTLGKLSLGEEAAAQKFKDLGLSAADFMGLTPDQAVAKLADTVSAATNPMTKFAVAEELMGKSGKEIIAIFNKGSAGFNALKDSAVSSGAAFTKEQGRMVEEANLAVDRVQSGFKIMAQAAALELAPVVTEIANMLKTWVDSIKAESIMGMIEGIATAVTWLVKIVDTVKVAWHSVASAVLAVTEVVGFLVLKTVQGMNFIGKLGAKSINTVVAGAEKVGNLGGLLGDKKFKRLNEDLEIPTDHIKETIDRVDALRRDEAAAAKESIQNFHNRSNEMENFFARARDRAKNLTIKPNVDFANFDKQLRQKRETEGVKIAEGLRTPFEKFNDTLKDLKGRLEDSTIGFDTFAKGSAKAFEDLEKERAKAEFKAPTAIRAGSAESIQALERFGREDAVKSIQERLLAVQQEMNERDKQRLEYDRQVAGALTGTATVGFGGR